MSVKANWQAMLAMACALLAFAFLPMTEGASTFMAVTIIMLIAMGAACVGCSSRVRAFQSGAWHLPAYRGLSVDPAAAGRGGQCQR